MSNEQLELSAFIKSVHTDLRNKTINIGFTEAWKDHLSDEKNLTKYADVMQLLATTHWEKNFNNKNSKACSRVDWVHKYCLEYYSLGENSGLIKQRLRELDIASKMQIKLNIIEYKMDKFKLKLLDVGSCYNPFSAFEDFNVTAIDIAPACPGVKKVDFINLQINENSTCCDGFSRENFEIVIFSFFLEYLPKPDLRFESCKKAYDLLKFEGILVIITPDSKHVGANSKLMKTWQCILAKIGFSRIKYEKLPHMHCMVFRKCLDPRISERWYMLYKNKQIYDEFYIPQDFHDYQNYVQIEEGKCVESVINMYSELPFNIWEDISDLKT